MQNIKVSVIIPVYNADKYLRTCLESVLNQSLNEMEIICIDDGSTDHSLDILKDYALKDSRITVLHQENKGVSIARNKGMAKAKGEYLCFVDADDFIHPYQLSSTYDYAKENNADIVVFGGKSIPSVAWVDQKLNVVNGIYTNPFDTLLNIVGTRPFICNKIFRTSLLKDNHIIFDSTLTLGEDQAFLFDVFPLANVIAAMDNKFYCYRQDSNSTMTKWNRVIDYKVNEHFKIVDHIVKNWQAKSYCKQHGSELAEWILSFLFQDLNACHFNFRCEAYEQLIRIVLNVSDFNALSKDAKNKIDHMRTVTTWSLTPRVSVIMPVYNAAEYLNETLAGLTSQTYPYFEMIFVDDGSNDGSLKILQEFAHKDRRVKIQKQEHLYAGAARNTGIQMAMGEYLLFLDADDFFVPQMIEKALTKIEKTDADICVFSANQMDNKTQKRADMHWTMKKELCPKQKECFSIKTNPKNIFAFTTAAPWNKFFKTDFIRKYNLKFQTTRSANDLAFIFTALALASKITLVDDVLLTYRVNNTCSLQGTQDKKPDAFYEAILELKNRLQLYGVYKQAEPAFLNFSLDYLFYNLGTLKSYDAYEQVFNLIKNNILETLGINNKTDTYFYAYQVNHIVEKWHDIRTLSMLEFAKKWNAPFCRNLANKLDDSIVKRETVIQPKISIIMPLLNSMDYLEECLDSVIRQTLGELEIICVDAGSTDGTIEFIENYARYDRRITLLHSDKKSYGHQVNMGIRNAHGEYMAIVESDDYILPDMYETLYNVATRIQVDFVKCDFTRFYGEKETRTYTPAHVLNNSRRYCTVGNPQKDLYWFSTYVLITPAIYSLQFIRDNHIQLNETPGASYQDNGFWFQVLMHAERIWFHPESFYMLRRDNPNSSVKSKSKVYAMCVEYDFIYSLFSNNKELVKKYGPVCAKLRMDNYNFTLDRIADEYKLDFLFKYAQDFRAILKRKELHGELFSDYGWNTLMQIIDNPVNYYFNVNTINENHVILNAPSSEKERNWEEDFRAMQGSVSFRVGRKITWLPRAFRGGCWCLRDHGITYTVKRIIEHLGIDMGTGDFRR